MNYSTILLAISGPNVQDIMDVAEELEASGYETIGLRSYKLSSGKNAYYFKLNVSPSTKLVDLKYSSKTLSANKYIVVSKGSAIKD
jgi:hypothetical protein